MSSSPVPPSDSEHLIAPVDSPVANSLAADIEKLNLSSVSSTKETVIFIQNLCLQHRFIRSRDTSTIVEKPERMRAVNIGLAAAIARLESLAATETLSVGSAPIPTSTSDDLAAALGRMNLAATDVDPFISDSSPLSVVKSAVSIDMLNHAAVKFIHGDVEGDLYLENLKAWARDSHDKILQGGSEIPEGLSQGDLFRTFFVYLYFCT